jgi:general secretion pathway protein D
MKPIPVAATAPARRSFRPAILVAWFALAATGLVAACDPLATNHPQATGETEAGTPAGSPLRTAPAAGKPRPAPEVALESSPAPARPAAPIIIPGSGPLIAVRGEAPPGAAATAGDVTLNFVDTDVREVLRAVLAGVLHLNYAVDSKVQATLTLQTSRPLKREEVLATLEAALRASNLALVENAGVYRVVPIEDAARSGAAALVVGQGAAQSQLGANTSYNVQVLPLRYVSAADMRQTIEPLLPKGAVMEVDAARNLVILSGTGQDLSTAVDLLRSFDVDWLKGMSFGIFPLQVSTPKDVAAELNTIFGAGGSVPLGGVLHFAPLDRMNAILVASPQRAYLDEARRWIERLDKGADENTPRLYEYHVQNSRAADLAKVLSQLFSNGSVQTVEPQTTPDKAFTSAVQAGQQSMSSLNGGGTSGLASSPLGGTAGTTPASPMPGIGATPGASPSSSQTPSPSPSSTSGSNGGNQGQPQSQGLASALGDAFGAERGGDELHLPQVRIVADEKNNTLVIFARPREYRMVEDALKRLDVVPLQVLIEATIAEVTLNDSLSYGTQWFFHKGGSNALLTQGTVTGAPSQVVPGFNYAFLTGPASVVLSALSAVTNVDVVSAPQLLVLDHHVATLQVGDEVPVPTAQITSTITNNAPLVNTIQYVNTGVILTVSPRVNVNGVITLDISQQVSNVDTTATSVATLGAPTIAQRLVDTSVTVQDGQTVALGGLITEQRQIGNSGIPVLTDIPVLGSLFGTKSDSKQRTELLVLLTPRVIHNADEADAATQELRRQLHTIVPDLGRQP